MDDKNPDPTIEQLDTPPQDPPAPSPADDAKADAELANGSGRFAVYDKDLLRFRGRVHDTRKGADDLKSELSKPKGVRRGRFEVREV